MAEEIRIALAGNPNVGKSTLFNSLTGARQHVGNWPGKTVEKKEGSLKHKGCRIKVIDLPGAYSLTAYSIEELISRNFIVDEHPDVVIHIVDATNLERNLYLTTQLIELGANVVVALNMVALAKKEGIEINEKKLSHFLGVPVIKIEAHKKIGVDNLLDEVTSLSGKKKPKKSLITYGKEVQEHISKLESLIRTSIQLPSRYNPGWIAIKLLEHDDEVIRMLKGTNKSNDILKEASQNRRHLEQVFGEDVDSAIADARYGFIGGAVKESIKKPKTSKLTVSDKIDEIVTNKFLGMPIFLLAMWLMFQITFTLSAPFMDWIDSFFGWLSVEVSSLITVEWFSSLFADGIIGGLGAVIVLAPPIFFLFLVLALLEDCGYMARAAFIMDRIMHKIGLHGKSFIPMILGFGCNVPAIMATRTLESKKDRILTILINPFMSCGARLPVYILFAAALFSTHQGLVVFSLYLLGIIIAIIMGMIFKKALFKGLSSPFVMELPPYRLPTIKGALVHMWERGSLFLKKAGTIIFVVVVIIWFLSSVPFGVEYASEQSVIGGIGKVIAPVFKPLGFGDWQSAVALTFGFAAKEVIVGTFGTLYGVEEAGLASVIRDNFTPLSAYAFLVFVLLYMPCMAVIAVIKRETNSWKWPIFTAAYTTIIAWLMAFMVYQGGMLLGLG